MRVYCVGREGSADRLIIILRLCKWGGDLYFSARPGEHHGKPRFAIGRRYGWFYWKWSDRQWYSLRRLFR